MRGIPVLSTDIAKLMFAPAGHMVASLIFFDDHFAFFALSIVKIAFKKSDFFSVAKSLMN